jgi:uncharacterized RDD family membrane protein YckC
MVGRPESGPSAADREQFTISSATGVDVSLAVAGPGSRSYAFVIDWHVRLLLALAWLVCAGLLVSGHVFLTKAAKSLQTEYMLVAVLPALAIYFLYHPVLEVAMRGRTPGKRLAGVRLVTQSGGTPSTGALLVRNIFRLIDAMPMFYAVGLVTSLLTAQRVRIGDLAAGTVLVHDEDPALQALAELGSLAHRSTLDPTALEVATDLLARWEALDDARRAALARLVLARIDPGADAALVAALHSGALRRRIETLLRSGTLP